MLVFIGITLGYHRHFAHKQFDATPLQEVVMLVCGTLCGGRDPISWVGVHRMHHQFSDTEHDPHPNNWKALFSVWRVNSVPQRFVKDLYSNPRVLWFHKYHKCLWACSAVVFLFGSIIDLWIAIQVLSWIGFGMLNYFGHKDGKPINRPILNIIAPFEGNHADHHQGKQTSLGTIRF